MSRKSNSDTSFNMAAEIRSILEKNNSLKGNEVYEMLVEKFPKEGVNKNSALVAFSNARRDLGISGKRKPKSRSKSKLVARPSTLRSNNLDLSALQRAQEFVSQVGGADAAIQVIDQLKSLQINK